jgi:putative phosphoesterase
MRVGVLADAHGNAAAVRIALEQLADSVDEVLFAGDAFSDHTFSNDTIELVRMCHARYVVGNHELNLLGPAGRRAREAEHVRAGNLRYVESAPTSVRAIVDGRRLLMVHGSPWEPFGTYLQPGHPAFARVDELDVDVLVLGHTHLPYVAVHGRTLVVNPGSLGRPERPDAPGIVSFAIVDTSAADDGVEAVQLIEFEMPRP